MKDLIGISPTGIIRSLAGVSFYYGIQPNAIQNLKANDEFTVVYGSDGSDVWRSVRFSVVGDQKDYDILDMRVLEPAEIAYLKEELNPAKYNEQSNPEYAIAS